MQRLASGLRINSAADDASGMAIAAKMSAQTSGLSMALQNAQDGQALMKIADGAMSQVGTMLSRMQELAVRATNGTLTSSDRQSLMDELNELRSQVNSISSTTEYNTVKLLNGSISTQASISGNDSIQMLQKPTSQLNGTEDFTLSRLASAAVYEGSQVTNADILSSGVTSSGTFSINGAEISVNAGDSLAAIVGKINAANDQTNVVATLDSGKDNILLTSGIIDSDAGHVTTTNLANIANSATPIVGYALQGEQYSINITGGSSLSSIGLTATSVTGQNAAGSINGVAMKANGTVLTAAEYGSVAYGMQLETDTYRGGNGTYIQNYVDKANFITHRSNLNDTATIKVNQSNTLNLQIGANYGQNTLAGINGISTNQLGIGGSSKYGSLADIDLSSAENADFALKTINKAITDVASNRSRVGASMNRLDYSISTLQVQRENMTAALSRIQDADISLEMINYTKQLILSQAGVAMLAQANSRAESVLQLLS
jgi:flagellin